MVTAANGTTLTAEDRARIAAAVAAAEARTSAEIVVVMETDPCEEGDATVALVAAGFLAIAVGGLLSWTGLRLEGVVIAQAALFAGLAALASSSRVRRALGVGRLPSHAAHQAALQAFDELGLARTKERTGVMIHVAIADRRVEIVADEGINAAIAPETWAEEVEMVVSAARAGRLVDGLVQAVETCGAALAQALPPEPGLGNELPNAPIVR